MQRKQRIKDIIVLLILSSIFVITLLEVKNLLKVNKSYFDFMKNEIIYWIFIFISFFMIIGLFFYICFKITNGTAFIYKDLDKEKNLNNIDFGQLFLFLDIFIFRKKRDCNNKLINHGTESHSEKNYFLRIFFSLLFLMMFLFIITHFLIPVFYCSIDKDKIEIYYNICYDILYRISLTVCFLLGNGNIYKFLENFAIFWCYYVKLFQLLGIFHFLENDFNKTINYHNYFLIIE
ncbi:hypothetical protein [Candidatus Phytoplasma mali]|nr:hypothetical protein [Candidatus Phytoplasma mali]